jgi:3-methyladenine DNA glycosylase Tag
VVDRPPKREAYREAFRGFDPAKVADSASGTSRHFSKIPASCATALRSDRPSERARLPRHTKGIRELRTDSSWTSRAARPSTRGIGDNRIPTRNELSDALSKNLKNAG